MIKTRASLSLLLVGMLITACSSIGPGFTIPPIVIPSFTIPPIVLPSGVSFPPIEIPSADANSGLCTLISPAEVGAALGTPVTVTETKADSCTYTSGTLTANIVIHTETGDLQTAKILLSEAKDITIGQYPAVIGGFMGVLLYIQRGGEQLVVQAVLMNNDAATQAQIINIGTIAASRW
jgi:hypothetical protein